MGGWGNEESFSNYTVLYGQSDFMVNPVQWKCMGHWTFNPFDNQILKPWWLGFYKPFLNSKMGKINMVILKCKRE